ncbi:MAG: hypothetical protein ACK6AY_15075, partial [Akkermansiaceae bacterium]
LPTIFGLSWLAIYASLRFAVPGGMAAESERICGGLAQFKNQQSKIVNHQSIQRIIQLRASRWIRFIDD